MFTQWLFEVSQYSDCKNYVQMVSKFHKSLVNKQRNIFQEFLWFSLPIRMEHACGLLTSVLVQPSLFSLNVVNCTIIIIMVCTITIIPLRGKNFSFCSFKEHETFLCFLFFLYNWISYIWTIFDMITFSQLFMTSTSQISGHDVNTERESESYLWILTHCWFKAEINLIITGSVEYHIGDCGKPATNYNTWDLNEKIHSCSIGATLH